MAGPGEGKAKEDKGRRRNTAAGREFVDLVIAYAKQETLGPLKSLGRYLIFGVSGSIALGLGLLLLLLAMLRALQTETGSTFGGNLSWLPYLITAGAAIAVAGLSIWRITKTPPARPAGRDGGEEGR